MSEINATKHTPWDVLADRLSEPGGLEMARLLEYAGLIGQSAPREQPSTTDSSAPRAIGPYQPSTEGGELVFVREPFQGDDFMWWRPSFTREELKPTKAAGACRICVIGESAAAGMFYTPHYSPSIALSELLAAAKSGQEFEVIDLTRNSMNAREVVTVAEAALQLDPDYVVVFAGNNWFAGEGYRWEGPAEERASYAQASTLDGARGIVRTFQDKVRAVADQTLTRLGALQRESKTEMVFVIPAVNLMWERMEPTAWLGGKRTRRWFELEAIALRALSQANHDAALSAARAMLELDGGICPTSHRILGKALLALGRDAEAAAAFEAELDHANAFDMLCQSVPGTPQLVREEIKSRAATLDLRCIDLREAFAAHTGSPVRWEHLFVDYCHLTPEGMKVAMAAVAASTLVHEGVAPPELEASALVRDVDTSVDPRVEAIARFYAAVYTAHFMSSVLPMDGRAIEERIVGALRASPSIVPFVLDYLRARNGALISCPILSGASHRVIGQSNNPFLDYAAVRGAGGVDALTVAAITRALDEVGANGREALGSYLEFYQRALQKGVDLTEPVYIDRPGIHMPWLKYESERETRRALPLYRSWLPSSTFTFVSDGKQSVELKLTCRLSSLADDSRGLVRLSVNGTPVSELPVGRKWGRHTVVLSASLLEAGFNRLSIDWPPLSADDDVAWAEAQRRYTAGIRPDVFPVFGELFSCVVRAV